MAYPRLLLPLFIFVVTAWAAAIAKPVLFHATSTFVFVKDKASSHSTYNAEFFCYMTERGYLSVGWWVSDNDNSNSSRGQLDLDSFHWLELGDNGSCNGHEKERSCRYRTQHIPVRMPDDVKPAPFPSVLIRTVVQSPSLWKEDHDQISSTYMDSDGVQVHEISTSRVLSSKPQTVGECYKVLRILKRAYETYDMDLGFKIRDPCGQEASPSRSSETISEL